MGSSLSTITPHWPGCPGEEAFALRGSGEGRSLSPVCTRISRRRRRGHDHDDADGHSQNRTS